MNHLTDSYVYVKIDVSYLSCFKTARVQVSFLAVPMLKYYREKGLGSNFPSLLNCGHDNHLYKDKLYSIVLFKGIILMLRCVIQ